MMIKIEGRLRDDDVIKLRDFLDRVLKAENSPYQVAAVTPGITTEDDKVQSAILVTEKKG